MVSIGNRVAETSLVRRGMDPLSTDAAALRVFERKVLHKIFGSVRIGDDFRVRSNSELYELLNDIDLALAPESRSNVGGCASETGIWFWGL